MFDRVFQSFRVLRASRGGLPHTAIAATRQAGRQLTIEQTAPEAPASIEVVIVTGSCCGSGLAPFDARAKQAVNQAIAEMGVSARIRILSATQAYLGGLPPQLVAEAVQSFQRAGRLGLPAILVNDRVAASGAPAIGDVERLKTAFRQAIANPSIEQEVTR